MKSSSVNALSREGCGGSLGTSMSGGTMGAIEIVFSWTADSFCFLGSGGISTMVGLDRVSTWL